MAVYDKLIGKTFDKLTVIDYIPGINGGRAMRRCICSCGNECLKDDKYLNKSTRRSCGCHLDEKTKRCAMCMIVKDKSEYHPLKSKRIGVQAKCILCESQYKKERYWNNRDAELMKLTKSRLKPENVQQRKCYYENNKKEFSIRYLKYMQDEHKKKKKWVAATAYQKSDHGKMICKKRYVKRMKIDMSYVLTKRLRRRVRGAVVDISKNISFKRSGTMELLGCSIPFFKKYFEEKFTDGMCWDRISEIHIDHIKPCSMFNLSKLEDQKVCFNYLNLQPLWARDNIIKSNNYSEPIS